MCVNIFTSIVFNALNVLCVDDKNGNNEADIPPSLALSTFLCLDVVNAAYYGGDVDKR